MKSIVLKFGLISGVVLSSLMAVQLMLSMNGTIDFDRGEIIGYTAMVLAFLMVFFGIRSYRETVGGGAITFGKAFQVGILIALIASGVFVVAWEIYYFGFDSEFGERYAAFTIEKMRAEGQSAAAIAEAEKQAAKFTELYKNPLFNIGITFLEAFPVGLIVTLVSAAILRRRTPQEASPAAALA